MDYETAFKSLQAFIRKQERVWREAKKINYGPDFLTAMITHRSIEIIAHTADRIAASINNTLDN